MPGGILVRHLKQSALLLVAVSQLTAPLGFIQAGSISQSPYPVSEEPPPTPLDTPIPAPSTAETTPEPPQPLAPQGVGEDPVPAFLWDAVAGATGYQVRVVNAENRMLVDMSVIAADVCTDRACETTFAEPLVEGDYTWQVRALADTEPGPWSEPLTFTVTLPVFTAVPVAPQGEVDTGTPVFSWRPVPEAVTYTLRVVDDVGTVVLEREIVALDGCSDILCQWAPVDSLPEGAYTWQVQPVGAEGTAGEWSTSLAFIIRLPAVLLAPTGEVGTGTAVFSWEPVAWAAAYLLQISVAEGMLYAAVYDTAEVCTVGRCTATPEVALAARTYTWTLQAQDEAGTGPWSEPLAFEVALPGETPPPALEIEARCPGQGKRG